MAVTLPDVRAIVTAAGDILIATASGVLTRLAKGTDGQVLTLASGLPSWAAGGGSATPITELRKREDFDGGVTATTGSIGTTGWGDTNGATPSRIDSESNHPGILSKGSSATIDTVAAMHETNVATGTTFHPTDMFEWEFIVRPTQIDANTTIRVGVCDGAVTNPPTNGLYAETLAADGTREWFGVSRAAGVETRTSLGATLAAGAVWANIKVRRVSAGGDLGIKLNALTEITFSANKPAVAMQAFMQIINAGAAVNKLVQIDVANKIITAMTRGIT